MKLLIGSTTHHLPDLCAHSDTQEAPDLAFEVCFGALPRDRAVDPAAVRILQQVFASAPTHDAGQDEGRDPILERQARQWFGQLRDALRDACGDGEHDRFLLLAADGLAQLTGADEVHIAVHGGPARDPMVNLLDDYVLVNVSDARSGSTRWDDPLLKHLRTRCGAAFAVAAISGRVRHGHIVLLSDQPRTWAPLHRRAARIVAQALAALAVPAA